MKINLEILDAAYLMGEVEINNLNTKELVPKMVFRRRLTKAAKLVIELVSKVNFTNGRIMYASAFGELEATAKILNAILNKEGISPTDFQNSVYNTPVSYASILENNQNEIMTISCGDNTSNRLLKLGAIKALDNDEILLVATETLNIKNIEQINSCIDYLEVAVALKVKVTEKEANINIIEVDKTLPKSIAYLVQVAKTFDKEKQNIIGISL
ncbi:beta-ketoacyl synthase chain length factor [Malaciobacter mytili]|uniref:beta-ketoacyl synthase chain length factor n=1 Tax=Malaciobacter mytili TaxID=603050 RepID=UPI003A853F2C